MNESLSTTNSNNRRFKQRWLLSFAPIVVGLALVALSLWLLTPAPPLVHAWPGDLEMAWQSAETDGTNSLDWADWDGDGDDDLAVGNIGRNRIYQNDNGNLTLIWSSPEADDTYSVAWGDVNGDGFPDLAVGNNSDNQPNRVYTNIEDANGNRILVWAYDLPDSNYWTQSVAWGDWDNDDDLDLAVGSMLGAPTQVYSNSGGILEIAWNSVELSGTKSVAWEDWDNDGDLDLAAGNYFGQRNQVYSNTFNTTGSPDLVLAWQSDEGDDTESVAWGDWDQDGYLDLAVGNNAHDRGTAAQPNRIYTNTLSVSGGRSLQLAWTSPEVNDTYSVAWGDWDGDGDPDLAVGNKFWPHKQPTNLVYANNLSSTGTRSLDLAWISPETDETNSIAWVDWDGDLDLDLAVGNQGQPNRIYVNGGGRLALVWSATEPDITRGLDWGDWDGDGDLDLAVANEEQPVRIYVNHGSELVLSWSSNEVDASYSVDWGDWDGDGDLDLAVGNGCLSRLPWTCYPSRVYANEVDANGNRFLNLAWTAEVNPNTNKFDNTWRAAWGDWDNDGDLDLAMANNNADQIDGIQVYDNAVDTQGNPDLQRVWSSPPGVQIVTLDWGDCNSDGFLDLVAGRQVYTNTLDANDDRILQSAWTQPETNVTVSVAWGDWDNDGDLDLAVGNTDPGPNRVYSNDGSCNLNLAWSSPEFDPTQDVAWGDWDGDGDLDLAVGNTTVANRVYINSGGHLALVWSSVETESSSSVAWGDWNNDGDLDLAVGNTSSSPNRLYANSGGNLALTWSSPERNATYSAVWGDYDGDNDLDVVVGSDGKVALYANKQQNLELVTELTVVGEARSVAWGDWDGDGDLDLAVGMAGSGNNPQQNYVYANNNGTLTLAWTSTATDVTSSVAWGDYDNDGDLDLVVGNDGQPNQVYRNESGILSLTWSLPENDNTSSIAWGDWDNDGDLDLAVGNYGQPNRVYRNDGGILSLAWSSPGSDNTFSVAWGDWNGDGNLDLAVGNDSAQSNRIYTNNGGNLSLVWSSPETDDTHAIAWSDWDGDGDLDLAVGNSDQRDRVYANKDGNMTLVWSSAAVEATNSLSWGDWENDGDPDLLVGHSYRPDRVYHNRLADGLDLVGSTSKAQIAYPGGAAANFYASATILEGPVLPITYTLFDPEGDAVRLIEAYYSLDGGSQWHPAIAAAGTVTTNVAASPTGVTHTYHWDVFASGVFGASDNVIFRLDVYQGFSGTVPSAYVLRSARTLPFRVRGTQVQVMSNTIPVGEAKVYRQLTGQEGLYQPFQDSVARPFLTNPAGYLQGYGEIGIGDQLVAMLPITSTDSYTLYHTSATPSVTGLDAHTVTQPGVQTLIVSPDNPLILFNLDLTLEWDGRNDTTFLSELETGIQRASELLYDVSNGQVALGEVRVHQAKENWMASDIVVYGRNNIRPRASMGGVVGAVTDDIGLTAVISAAYLPGQVRMGPVWDPFGQNEADLGQDWQRALAHELSHYLLFLPDNYLGLGDNGALATVDCQGSFMTNTYDDDYSEFLTAAGWQGDCLNTVAQHTTGRTDWETVTTFYEMLHGDGGNLGPARLPLNVTRVNFIEPAETATALPARNFDLRDADSGALLPLPQAQGYLFKTGGTAVITDDTVIALGSSGGNGDRIMVRGLDVGDRLCLFANGRDPARLGCLDDVTGLDTAVPLAPAPNWQPDILVTPINSRTVAITVTQSVPGGNLNVQVFPAYGSPDDPDAPVLAPWAEMNQVDADTFTQSITLDNPAFEGFIRVWVPGSDPIQEAMTQLFLSAGWGPNVSSGGTGANTRAWGANNRLLGAPVASGDGQATIFNLEDIFADTGTASLQALTTLPHLPAWLTPVGQGYRFISAVAVSRTIAFEYLQRDVPDGYEYALNLYYLPDGSSNWDRLDTQMDTAENLATARMPENAVHGQGIYALAATVVLPSLNEGWNLFGYPLPETRPITTALASIEGDYASVYHYDDAAASAPWRLYDATLVAEHPEYAALVNELVELAFGRSYWIYATEATTLYLGVDNSLHSLLSVNAFGMPPATFYGPVPATDAFTPTVGMEVTAVINNNVCGQSTVQERDNQLAYTIQVMADTGDGCGAAGRGIAFKTEGQTVSSQTWDNSQAWFHPLALSETRIYLPIVLRGP